jgi:hypothetical protein
LSSAILYVAIVAIWAGVLIPRWLRRDSSTSERASDDTTTTMTMTTDTPIAEEQAAPPRKRERERAYDAGRSRPADPAGRAGAPEARPTASDSRAGDSRAGDSGREDVRRGRARDEEHARVLSARRRLLGMLVVLTIGSFGLQITGLAAWWVVVPPTVMLLGYVVLLREASKADAERRQWERSRAAAVANKPEAPAAPAAPVAPPVPVRGAEIIDISASKELVADEEFYDQYADAKLRAVGDLDPSCRSYPQHRRSAERDVGVEGELLVRREPQAGIAAGEFGDGELCFALAEVRA